eukprot:TRINITY_DN692_c0_g1_i2.p1 TRINITY_DN692_c0_g1~~TRINITY_DN692_c0_g1_i2.p1  ORF type:complete len:124 (+),score=30.99 TRINITY_DN692_c0_g1_i2:43-372(+)
MNADEIVITLRKVKRNDYAELTSIRKLHEACLPVQYDFSFFQSVISQQVFALVATAAPHLKMNIKSTPSSLSTTSFSLLSVNDHHSQYTPQTKPGIVVKYVLKEEPESI